MRAEVVVRLRTCVFRRARGHTFWLGSGALGGGLTRRRQRRSARRVATSRAGRRTRGPLPRPMCCPWLALMHGAAANAKIRRAAAFFSKIRRENLIQPLPTTSKAGTTPPRVAPPRPPGGARGGSLRPRLERLLSAAMVSFSAEPAGARHDAHRGVQGKPYHQDAQVS